MITADDLVLPIGHYMGPFYPAPGAPLKYHAVRVGRDTARLPDDHHFSVWALAHGIDDESDAKSWNRQAVERAARETGIADASRVFDAVRDLGLVVSIPLHDDAAAVEFAQRYRMQSLLVGLGNRPDSPLLHGIGLPGLDPAVRVLMDQYELWQWGHLGTSLWHSIELNTQVWRESGATDPEKIEPRRALAQSLRTLHLLVSHSAAYVDRVI